MGFRNRIINGDMRIDQRNAGAAVTINAQTNTFVVDRFKGIGQSSDGVYTLQQSTTAPTGFVNSVIATVTTDDASIGATQFYMFRHPIEGTNIADLGWGTASAKTVTLSFQVRSSLTGTFGGVITNSAQNRSYPFTYSISSANTWEAKSITIAGDTSGTWLTTTGIGLEVIWGLGVGSTYSGTAGSWAGTTYYSATGATNVIGTNGATWYITGVQLEVGSVATEFERRPYGTELQLCYRYYYEYFDTDDSQEDIGLASAYSADQLEMIVRFPVTMRSAPTYSQVGASAAFSYFRNSASGTFNNFSNMGGPSTKTALIFTGGSDGFSGTATGVYRIRKSTSAARASFSSEL
jgi:hypothetical protein